MLPAVGRALVLEQLVSFGRRCFRCNLAEFLKTTVGGGTPALSYNGSIVRFALSFCLGGGTFLLYKLLSGGLSFRCSLAVVLKMTVGGDSCVEIERFYCRNCFVLVSGGTLFFYRIFCLEGFL